MRKISKRAILILAIFAFSIIPVMPAYAAIAITDIDAVTGDKGDSIVVTGDGVVAGKTVNLYWDLVQAWDGVDGLLNSTTADEDGEYEIWFDVPEAVFGHHKVHVWDEFGNTFAASDFDVFPKVSVSPDTGLGGDTDIAVTGYGFHGSSVVAILFNDTNGISALETDLDVIEGDGVEDEFDGELLETPVYPGTVKFYNGTVAFDIVDDGEGKLTGANVSTGKINYVSGAWEIEFNVTQPVGSDFDADYMYVEEAANNMEVLVSSDSTDALGSFDALVDIPAFADGVYEVYVYDGNAAAGSDGFDIGPVIELIPDSGPVGAVIKAKGRGFGDKKEIHNVTLGGILCYNTSEVTTNNDGAFTISFVIPSVSDTGDYTVVVTNEDGTDAEEDFEVDGLPKITVTPAYGGPNEIVQIQGWNFTQISGTDVDVYYQNGVDTLVDTYETNGDGEFSGSLQVPPEQDGDYTVNATTEDHMINGTTTFRMGFVFVRVTPTSGEEGTDVNIDGTGFTFGDNWNATLDGEDVIDSTAVDAGGDIEGNFFIPNMGTGTYDLTILDEDSGIEVHVDITVTAVTYLELYPLSAANGFNIIISGYHFSDDDTVGLTFELYNTTQNPGVDEIWDITANVFYYDPDEDNYTNQALELDDDGLFTGWWEVYGDDELSLGTYWLNVTDDNDLFAQIEVGVVDPDVSITSRKAAYEIDDTLAFTIESTFTYPGSYIEISDPNGDLYWVTDDLDTWLKVGLIQVVPYYSQTSGQNPMVFTSDAPQGTWSYTWYDADDDEIDSGTFTLGPSSTAVLTEQMTEISGDVTELSDTVTELSTTVGDLSDTVGDISDAVSDTAAAVASVTSSVSDLADTVGDIADEAGNAKTAADNAKAAADAAKDAADDAKTAASGLTTLVYGAIGASLVAALAAIVSLMQISRRIAG